MPKITIGPNEIMKGWGLNLTSSDSRGFEAPPGYYSRSFAINPFRHGRIGQIAPGETFTALTDGSTRVTGLPLNGIVASTGEAFCILDNSRIVQFGTDDVIDANYDVTLAAAHSAHTTLTGKNSTGQPVSDVIGYKNATNEYILYSWDDNTDGDVGRMIKDGTSQDDDFLSTASGGAVLTKGVPHMMKTGPDGNVYILNGQYVIRLTVATSVVEMTALNLGVGFVATSLELSGNFLVIVGYQATGYISTFSKGESKAWFWDTTSPFYNQIYDLKDNYVSSVFAGDFLYAFTQGRNNSTKVKIFNGSRFEDIFESPQIGNAPRHGGVELFNRRIVFSRTGDSGLHTIDGRAFHQQTFVSTDGDGGSTDVGMVKNLSQGTLYVGRSISGTYGIVKLNTSGYAKSAEFIDSIRSLPYKSNIYKIIIYFSTFGTDASVWVSLFKDYASIGIGGADDLLNKTLTNTVYGNVSSISIPVKNAFDVNSFLLHLYLNHSSLTTSATAPVAIRMIEVYYNVVEKV